MYDQEGDKSAAFQHHYDSYKCFPGDIQVIEWLASYYIESQFPEKAANYFARASIIEPHEVKWHLMNASCLRKIGNYNAKINTLNLFKNYFISRKTNDAVFFCTG